jgi:hypothetical protein
MTALAVGQRPAPLSVTSCDATSLTTTEHGSANPGVHGPEEEEEEEVAAVRCGRQRAA